MSQEFLPKILKEKAREVAAMKEEELQPLRETYRLYDYLKSHPEKLQVIAEVKKASPSLGDIHVDVDIVVQAKTYEENGAVMISVLTDAVSSISGKYLVRCAFQPSIKILLWMKNK